VSIPADKKLYQRQIEATDRQIDALVYELYGLTEEEIAIVEEATTRWTFPTTSDRDVRPMTNCGLSGCRAARPWFHVLWGWFRRDGSTPDPHNIPGAQGDLRTNGCSGR